MGEHCDQCQVRHPASPPGLKAPPARLRMVQDPPAPNPGLRPQTDQTPYPHAALTPHSNPASDLDLHLSKPQSHAPILLCL